MVGHAWICPEPVITLVGRPRKEDWELETGMHCIARPCFKNNKRRPGI